MKGRNESATNSEVVTDDDFDGINIVANPLRSLTTVRP